MAVVSTVRIIGEEMMARIPCPASIGPAVAAWARPVAFKRDIQRALRQAGGIIIRLAVAEKPERRCGERHSGETFGGQNPLCGGAGQQAVQMRLEISRAVLDRRDVRAQYSRKNKAPSTMENSPRIYSCAPSTGSRISKPLVTISRPACLTLPSSSGLGVKLALRKMRVKPRIWIGGDEVIQQFQSADFLFEILRQQIAPPGWLRAR